MRENRCLTFSLEFAVSFAQQINIYYFRLVDTKREAKENVPFVAQVGFNSEESSTNPIDAFLSIKRVVQNRNSLFGLLRENTAQGIY